MASIRERNGSYQITVSTGRDIYGKKLRETVTFRPDPALTPKKREKAVADFARDFEAKVMSGAAMDGRKITLQEFSERWIREYAQQNLQPATVNAYRSELTEKILPTLGHLKLSELKPHNINAFFVALSQDGVRKDGKKGGYSKATIAKTRNVISSVLRTAAEWEIIDRNPCDKVRLQGESVAEKLKFFTPEQTAAFLDYIEQPYTVKIKGHKRTDDTGLAYTVGDYETTKTVPEQLKVLFNLAVYTGLRKGEILALQWKNVDLAADIVRVSKAVTMVEGKPEIKTPKTKTSHRTVSIPPSLSARLRKLHKEQLKYRLYVGDYWQGNDWIFTQDNGKLMSYSTPYQALQDIIRRHNADKESAEQLPQIPFHGLRHTSATLLIASKQDMKTVSNRLGHAQTSTTMNIYAHALQESDRKAAAALENILAKQA